MDKFPQKQNVISYTLFYINNCKHEYGFKYGVHRNFVAGFWPVKETSIREASNVRRQKSIANDSFNFKKQMKLIFLAMSIVDTWCVTVSMSIANNRFQISCWIKVTIQSIKCSMCFFFNIHSLRIKQKCSKTINSQMKPVFLFDDDDVGILA